MFSQIMSGALFFALSLFVWDMVRFNCIQVYKKSTSFLFFIYFQSVTSAGIDYIQVSAISVEFAITTTGTLSFCYLSTRVSYKLLDLGDISYNSMWYKYPANYQKYVLNLVMFAQKPQYFTGFGVVNCTLELFAVVCAL